MNIHRKDRAKLKELVSRENFLPLDSNKSTPTPDSCTREKSASLENQSTDDHDNVPVVKEYLVIPPILLKSGDQEEASARHFDKQVENIKVDDELSCGDDELDLELRLGPEPQSQSRSRQYSPNTL
ncbi:hypothetical protein PHJA_001991900 [Phtheirospermum japonicum]|uniref:Uncharacterized protein n=1 Tax=Phtheirospermum japonicum TaxID=374723 RepID=A0A830CFP6_9LAMI|nr:hypothetical protein PHJA_001991900 [Phtheirospermum japonicum]